MQFYSQISEEFPEFFVVYGENKGRYPYSNSMLIQTDGENAVLFDCGIGHKLIRKLKREFNIRKVFLSHWHEDHMSGCSSLKDTEIYCHNLDFPPLKDFDIFLDYYMVDELEGPLWDGYSAVLEFLKVKPVENPISFENNEIIKISDDIKVRIIHTPGHSAGHCCFYEPKRRIIFAADIDLAGLGPWYGCKDSSVNDFENSIKLLQDLDIEYAVSGHKDLFIGKNKIMESLKQYLNVIYKRDEKVLNQLSENTPKIPKDLERTHIVYKNYEVEFSEYIVFAENIMIQYHLERLLQEGKIGKENKGYILS